MTNTFSGFRSRWTIPFSCAAARPARDLDRDVDRLADRQRRRSRPVAQRLALEQLRDEVRRAVVRADVVERDDVGVGERRDGARLLLEAAQAVRVRRQVAGQDLDRDVAPEARVAGAVDLSHAARTEGRDDLVRTETHAGTECHASPLSLPSL